MSDRHNSASQISQEVLALLPMTPAVFYTLFALAHEEQHGYAIMQLVEKISEGAVSMGPGTLYSTLQRLLSLRLVEETTRYKRPDELERRRRFYRLTPLGRKMFDLEISRMKSVVRRAAATRLRPIEQDEE